MIFLFLCRCLLPADFARTCWEQCWESTLSTTRLITEMTVNYYITANSILISNHNKRRLHQNLWHTTGSQPSTVHQSLFATEVRDSSHSHSTSHLLSQNWETATTVTVPVTFCHRSERQQPQSQYHSPSVTERETATDTINYTTTS